MEGSGVTNYAVNKPAYAYSTATTEFDDALIQRGIVTHTQAMMAKGATVTEAHRLTALNLQQQQQSTTVDDSGGRRNQQNSSDDSSSCDDDDDDDDDSFMEKYRQDRLSQIQQTQEQRVAGTYYGQAVHIGRNEWMVAVNEASQTAWVVVCLTSTDTERTGCTEAACHELATAWTHIKFVFIPAHHAVTGNNKNKNETSMIAHELLPALLLYRHGIMQKQLFQLPPDMTTEQLYDLLHPLCGA